MWTTWKKQEKFLLGREEDIDDHILFIVKSRFWILLTINYDFALYVKFFIPHNLFSCILVFTNQEIYIVYKLLYQKCCSSADRRDMVKGRTAR